MNKLALIDVDGTLVSATEFDETKAKVPEYINYWNKQTMNAEVFYEGQLRSSRKWEFTT